MLIVYLVISLTICFRINLYLPELYKNRFKNRFNQKMTSFTADITDKVLSDTRSKKICSDLGYFSKPFRIERAEGELIVKLYLPVKNLGMVSSIIKNHDDYIAELNHTGLRIPRTIITSKKTGRKHQIVIVQESFKDDDLLRNRIKKASSAELTSLCSLIFEDIFKFWRQKNSSLEIGFHPTLRNYSLREGNLYFFDTFPPMLMSQKKLNRLIITMSPYGGLIKKFIPQVIINMVTDEYYCLKKMFVGIVGSCCRLRPDDAGKILDFSSKYVMDSELLSESEKASIIKLLKKPPELSKIWILIRKLTGNTGYPNIKSPALK